MSFLTDLGIAAGQGLTMAAPAIGMVNPAAGAAVGLGGGVVSNMLLGREHRKRYEAAQRANLERQASIRQGYADRLGLVGSLRGANEEMLTGYRARRGMLDDYGESARRDIDVAYDRQQGAATQGLLGRGLSNTTVAGNMARGIEYDRERSTLDLEDQLRMNRLGLETDYLQAFGGARAREIGLEQQLTRDALAFEENIQNPYPDAGAYRQAMASNMQAGMMGLNQMIAQQNRPQMMDLGYSSPPYSGPAPSYVRPMPQRRELFIQ